MTAPDYPNDADGDALRRVASAGADMTRPMKIDFTIAVPDRATGQAIAELAADLGYSAEVGHDKEDDAWTCYCSRTMVATYAGVIEAQRELESISAPLGGDCDGWGTFGE